MLPWARLLCRCFSTKVAVRLDAVVVTLRLHFMKYVDVPYFPFERENVIDHLLLLICFEHIKDFCKLQQLFLLPSGTFTLSQHPTDL